MTVAPVIALFETISAHGLAVGILSARSEGEAVRSGAEEPIAFLLEIIPEEGRIEMALVRVVATAELTPAGINPATALF